MAGERVTRVQMNELGLRGDRNVLMQGSSGRVLKSCSAPRAPREDGLMKDEARTGLIIPYPARQAASIVALAAFNVAWVSRAILPFAIKLRSLAFRVVVE